MTRKKNILRSISGKTTPQINPARKSTAQQSVTKNHQSKAIEQQLKQSDETFRIIAENTNNGIIIATSNGIIVYANKCAAEITGYSVDELLKITIKELVHPDELIKIMERYRKILAGENVSPLYETVIINKGGRNITIECTSATTSWHGQPADLSIFRDITKRKKVEDTLVKLRKAVDTSGEVIFLTDHDGIITYINPEFTRLYGFTADEVVGKVTARILKSGLMKPQDYEFFWKTILSGQVVKGELINKCKDGRMIPIEGSANPVFDEKGSIIGFLAIQRDISARKKMEEVLKENEEKYHTLFENANFAIFIADIETGIITDANRSAEKLLGKSREEIIGIRQSQLHPPEQAEYYRNFFQSHIEQGQVDFSEAVVIKKDWTLVPVQISATVMEIKGKKIIQGIFQDITERKQLEKEKDNLQAQLFKSQKMEAIGILAGGIAHDFNNLLTIILSNAQFVSESVDKTSTVYNDLNEISLAAARAGELTKQLLLYSRKQPMGFYPLNINNIINNLLKMLRRLIGEDIMIKSELEPDIWTIKADESNIEQTIANLCVNAKDAMPEGGTITIKSENIVLSEDKCKTIEESQPGSYVRLSIADIGVGMDNETVKHIFEPFYSTKGIGKGTGLGLSVVYGIIKAHHGWINVYSELSHGTVFKIYLPAEKTKEAIKSVEEVALTDLQGCGENILIIEDEVGILTLMKRLLINNGYSVYTATNSEEAISIFKNNFKDIDLVISDMILPDKAGLETVEQLKLIKNDILVILNSGYLDDKSKYTVIQEKGYGFIQKPFKTNSLLKLVREKLDIKK